MTGCFPARKWSSSPTRSPLTTASRPASAASSTARSSWSTPTAGMRRSRRPREQFQHAVVAGQAAGRPDRQDRGDQRGRGRGTRRMIRLGSAAGYPFEGPRLLAGWTAPDRAAVYVIMYKPDPIAKPEQYAVIYVGHGDDLSQERFPFRHPAPPAGPSGPGTSGRSTSPPARRRAPAARTASRSPGNWHRDLPSRLQRPAVRPGLERRVDRRLQRPHHQLSNQARPRQGVTGAGMRRGRASPGPG